MAWFKEEAGWSAEKKTQKFLDKQSLKKKQFSRQTFSKTLQKMRVRKTIGKKQFFSADVVLEYNKKSKRRDKPGKCAICKEISLKLPGGDI